MVVTIIFIVVKETLHLNGNSIIYGDFVSCTETKRNLASKMRSWQILIEKHEEWKKQLSGLQICKKKRGRMKRNMQGRKDKEKNKEHILEIKQHSEQCEDKDEFSKTRQHEGGYDKIDMSYAHQKDEKSEKTLSIINEKRDEKYNMFYEFLLIVECVF
jgi:hypothetical protein